MAVVVIAREFFTVPPATFAAVSSRDCARSASRRRSRSAGALVVIGLVSAPLLMEEIDRFAGVKAVIVLPPLILFALFVYTRRFGNEPPSALGSALAPVRVYQLAILGFLAAAAYVYISRSGNQSDVTPSAFELALRSNLTSVLGVRPRFKEFAIGFPLLMLLPSLRLEHKRLAGWLFAIGIAIGTSDIVDTFSHLHTPLVVSLLRILNGAVIGIVIGIVVVAIYRAVVARTRPRTA